MKEIPRDRINEELTYLAENILAGRNMDPDQFNSKIDSCLEAVLKIIDEEIHERASDFNKRYLSELKKECSKSIKQMGATL